MQIYTAGFINKLSPESLVNHWRHMCAIAWTKLIPAGNLVSAHRPGVATTHVWCVTRARCMSGATGAADSGSAQRPNSLEYQICTAPEPFDTLVTGLSVNSVNSVSSE